MSRLEELQGKYIAHLLQHEKNMCALVEEAIGALESLMGTDTCKGSKYRNEEMLKYIKKFLSGEIKEGGE